MDPITQSAQISSSQGFADGHNSAAKDSKLSDSFLSSSPVSLIQSPQDKRVGSDKNSELVKTSLHFSQSPSSSPGNYGSQSDESPDSPIKTSPVSERIKALEALVAKKKEPDFRSDGYSHYRDRHTDKRSSIEIQKAAFEKSEKTTTTPQKKGSSSDKESPDSPFEILGECKPLKELEDTEEWMKAHLPPMPEFQSSEGPPDSKDVSPKQEKEHSTSDTPASFAGVPDAFMDSSVETESSEEATVPQNPYAEEECDFDLSFLPTAYMCNQLEKNYDSVVPVSPPSGFESKSPMSTPEHNEKTQFTADPDPPEAVEMDSSGESDDTVIEDGVPVHASTTFQTSELQKDVDSAPTTSDVPKDEQDVPPVRSERKLMQVPTINVIETDEPNYSEEEMELEAEDDEEDKDTNISKDQDVKMSDSTISDSCVAKAAETHPLENQFVEGYSPPSSPVEPDMEFSPKHKAQELSHEAVAKGPQEPQSADDFMVHPKDRLPDKEPFEDFSDHDDEWGDQTMDVAKPISATAVTTSFTTYKMDEKASTEVTETPLEAHNPKSSFIRDEIYDRESFDYDYDAPPSPADDGEDSEPELATDQSYINPFLVNTDQNTSESKVKNDNDANQDTLSKRYPQDPYSIFYTEPVSITEPEVDNRTRNMNLDANCNTIKGQETETQHTEIEDLLSETKEDPGDLDPANSEPADSFVEFMRECLKSRQDEETNHAEDCLTSNIIQHVHSSPTLVTDLEQERLTISALKELGSSQEEEMEPALKSAKPYKEETIVASAQPSTQSPCPPNTQPESSQSNPALDSTYAREVEAIDEWVAEAYHLAEHVLTAVLTHLSVKDLVHWRDPKKSGVVFGVSMLMLLSLAAFSVISVISYLLLALLCVTITFRIYKSVVQAVQKSSEGHPFKSLIEKDVSIPPETFRKHVDASLTYINRALKQLSRLFLVEDLVDSLKLAVVMWLLTYVGAVFNGITILILADILLFAVPPIYEKNKTQIDQYIDLARTQINTTMAKLQEKLPGAMKRTKSE